MAVMGYKTPEHYEIIRVYVVYIGGDDRYIGLPKLFFTNEQDALICAKGKGYYESDAVVRPRKAIRVGLGIRKYYLLDGEAEAPIELGTGLTKEEKIKIGALKKLSAEERKVLGL